MSPDKTLTKRDFRRAAEERVFSVTEANRALVLVRRVVGDIVHRYAHLKSLRDRRELLADVEPNQDAIDSLEQRIDACVSDLNQLNRELTEIGCVLKDWETGLIDFPAMLGTRRVWLCWRLGEPEVKHWHELHEGFAGRSAVEGAEFD